jgi:hypothetical protein
MVSTPERAGLRVNINPPAHRGRYVSELERSRAESAFHSDGGQTRVHGPSGVGWRHGPSGLDPGQIEPSRTKPTCRVAYSRRRSCVGRANDAPRPWVPRQLARAAPSTSSRAPRSQSRCRSSSASACATATSAAASSASKAVRHSRPLRPARALHPLDQRNRPGPRAGSRRAPGRPRRVVDPSSRRFVGTKSSSAR